MLIEQPSSHLQSELQVKERQGTTKEGTNQSQDRNKESQEEEIKEVTAKHRSYLN